MPHFSAWKSRLVLGSALFSAPLGAQQLAAASDSREPTSWRLDDLLKLPPTLHLGASQRIRYEHLTRSFRPDAPAHDRALALRTTLLFEWRPQPLFVGVELADSRHHFTPDEAPVNTTHVNPIDLLQGYVGATFDDVLAADATARVTLGRQTLDLGSRRLVARNRFRNTINSFFGLHTVWSAASGHELQAFVLAPVERRPTEVPRLRRNAAELDQESFNVWLAGLSAVRRWPGGIQADAYLLGLHERDADDSATSNRRLLTPGLRLLRKPAPSTWNFELELAGQLGTAHASRAADDTTELSHLACFVHSSGGYTLPLPALPHLELLFDWASGDADPTDGRNGRFDTLFGARRFDFGPTGIYGAFARGNLLSPGAQLDAKPFDVLSGFVSYRAVWLASARDAWTVTGLSDPSAASGSFLGHQLEVQLRFWVHPESLSLETGVTHLWLGEFATSAPGAAANGDPTYIHAELALTL